MSDQSFILLEDNRVRGHFADESEAIKAMNDEHRKDLFGLMLKKSLLRKFISGKYQLKRYMVVRVLTIRTVNSDDDLSILKEGSN